jgi:gluconate 2-dehydrogenase subunit 3-like protein
MEASRRGFLTGAGAIGLLTLVAPDRLAQALADTPRAGRAGHFLTAHELDTLRALVDRLVPGPPDDPAPGALQAGCADAIDLLLGAFEHDPPLIHAGGPFSDRAGARQDHFKRFVALDAHAELGWRLRVEGSRGRREREFAGPVVGLQQIYREGLAHLDVRAGGSFEDASAAARDAILADAADARVQSFRGTALANTLEAMYGPPEYGGNRGLVGWKLTGWPGDVQPRGYTPAEVSSAPPAAGEKIGAARARALARRLGG